MTVGGDPTPIYPVREDSRLLLPFAKNIRGLRVLEIGCGRGAVALAAAREGARVVATDLNPHALRTVRDVALDERLEVELVRTDLAAGLSTFDRIFANPPYLPTPAAARDPDRWINLALDGGPDGLSTTRRLFEEIPNHLAEHGRGYLVLSSRQSSRALTALIDAARAAGRGARDIAQHTMGDERLTVLELTRGTDGSRA